MDVKGLFRNADALLRLLYVNVGVFVVVKLLEIVLTLFNVPVDYLSYLEMPASLALFAERPWALLTYMFMHADFLHLFFNMLCLYWFGKMFLEYFTQKQLVGLYVFGGIAAGLVYMLAYNVFPYFTEKISSSMLLGASGAVMAIILAVAAYAPNNEIRIFLIGTVKLKWVAAVIVLVSVFGTISLNAGGEFAHLGGALFGFLYVSLLRKGKDLVAPFNWLVEKIVDLLKRKPRIKVSSKKSNFKSDMEFNAQRNKDMDEMNEILDKVKKCGYANLTDEEKRRLFDKSQKV